MSDNAGMKPSLLHRRCLWLAVMLVGCGTSLPEPQGTAPITAESVTNPAVMPTSQPDLEPETLLPPQVEPLPTESVPTVLTPRKVFRPRDDRPQRDAASLAALGIRRWSSQHLVLYSDIEPEAAARLPGLVDQLYSALVDYFGALPPAQDGRDFQITGYLIRDLALFRETGLVPEDLPTFEHGRHRGYEFWLRDQPFDYYRAHLLLHEATHCFMTIMPDQASPVWYLEGMAEHFGTHRVDNQGRATFGIFPQRREDVPGWGRITLIQQATAAGKTRTLPQIFALNVNEFGEPLPYAWTWAACEFLARHPRYRERFRELGRNYRGTEFVRELERLFASDQESMTKEWLLLIQNLQYGYDIERAAIEFQQGELLTDAQAVSIRGDRGWQSTAVLVTAGEKYRISASGQVILATEPKPWVSEANGISIDYFGGHPLGKLLACIDPETPSEEASMLRVFALGSTRDFQAPFTGTLYLRVNDGWDRLSDNTGEYRVTIQRISDPE